MSVFPHVLDCCEEQMRKYCASVLNKLKVLQETEPQKGKCQPG